MKRIASIAFGLALLLPFFASAQSVPTAVPTSASTQQSFLSELQFFKQVLATLEVTLDAMIATAGGSGSSSALPDSSTDFPGSDLSSKLLRAISGFVATSTFSTAVNTATIISTSTTNIAAPVTGQTIANQLDPSCLSMLFPNNAQCGGLYFCRAGVAKSSSSYWSATACAAH